MHADHHWNLIRFEIRFLLSSGIIISALILCRFFYNLAQIGTQPINVYAHYNNA